MARNYLQWDEKCWGMGCKHIFTFSFLGQWLHEGFLCPSGKEMSTLAGWAAVSVQPGAVAGDTQHPPTLLLGAGGKEAPMDGHTRWMDPCTPPLQRLFVPLNFKLWMAQLLTPSTRILHVRYGPYAQVRTSVPAAANSAQGVNALFLLLCYPHLWHFYHLLPFLFPISSSIPFQFLIHLKEVTT